MWSGNHAVGLDIVNLVLAQQKAHALRKLLGCLAAARDHALEIELDLTDFDPMFLAGAANRFHRLGRIEQRLRRDTAPVQTDATGLVALDYRHAHLELARANRRDVAARSRSDHHQVVS